MDQQSVCYSLLDVPAGLSVHVEEIDGPPAVRSRLCCLGITPGTVISIFPSSGRDMRRICVRGSSLVLCRDVAQFIRCTVMEDCSCAARCGLKAPGHPSFSRAEACCESESQY